MDISKHTDTVFFNDTNRENWIKTIVLKRTSIAKNRSGQKRHITLSFTKEVIVGSLEPIHIVTLMCFIEHLHQIGYKVRISAFMDVSNFLNETLKLRKYYEGDGIISHVQSEDEKILNLWKVKQKESIMYSQSVTDYFNKNFFEGYDMTALKNSLDEAYANIADHSESNDNAFSYIVYDSDSNKICIGICDFGLGIPTTLRKANNKYRSDSEALSDSIKLGVTAGTNPRNRGFGLDNILSSLTDEDVSRIVSNKAMIHYDGNRENIKIFDLPFDFKGTLIYFEVSTHSFPENEVKDEISIG